jgi:hypothetical protein
VHDGLLMSADRRLGVAAVVAALLLAATTGWFLLSWQVMGTAPGDAAGEAVGVGFALLIVVSVVGAVRDRHREKP